MKSVDEYREVFADARRHLSHIEKLGNKLDGQQKAQLTEVVRSILILLVALRRASHLGDVSIRFIEEKL